MSIQDNSTQGLFFIRATVFAAVVLGIVAALPGATAQDKNGLRIAVVNPGKLVSEYKFAKSSTDTLESLSHETQVALDAWGKYPLLSVADQDALVKLLQKEKPGTELTKQEKDQVQSYITKHDTLLKEFNDLLVKPNGATTAQDTARLEAFKKIQSDTVNRISAKKADATSEIGKKQDEFNQKIDKDVRDALNKVAKEKGMNLVFSSQVVLFADADITDEVLKHLNK